MFQVVRVRVLVVIAAGLVGAPSIAAAHHVVSELGVADVEPRTSAELFIEAGGFELGAQAGDWLVLAPAFEVAVVSRLSLRARVPFAWIAYDDGHDVHGIGDVELATKARVYAPPDGGPILSAGLGAELPTGDEEEGLGGGHLELVPFVTAAHEGRLGAGHWVLAGLVGDRIALGGDGDASARLVPRHGDLRAGALHGSPIAPHTDHEVAAAVTVAWVVDPVFVSAETELIISFDDDAGDPPLSATLAAGWSATRRYRLAAGVDLPIAGEERFEWRARAGVTAVW